MLKKYADKWVRALLSGKYKQTEGLLSNGEGHCCLGVLCEVVGIKPKITTDKDSYSNFSYLGEEQTLPHFVMEKTNFKTTVGALTGSYSLTEMNDNGASFEQIAKVIKERYKEL